MITNTPHEDCLKYPVLDREGMIMEIVEAYHWNAFITLKKLVGNERAVWLLRRLANH